MRNVLSCVPAAVADGAAAVPDIERSALGNLLALRAVLVAEEIPFLLIRSERDEPALAIDQRYRPRVDALVSAAAGPGTVDIEFWHHRADGLLGPRPNALTRERIPAEDLQRTRIRRFGYDWDTLRGMFDVHAGDVDFDIDVVFSWVDAADPARNALRSAAISEALLGEGDGAPARVRQIDELRYALRSVYANAPWVRRIFIATDCTPPAWLDAHPQVTIVRAAEHFSDRSSLPTFNSHAVESQLHHIPGLSEHFLYANDDMFFGRPMRPTMFFTAGGISKFIESPVRIGTGTRAVRRSGFENAARNNRQLLRNRFGQLITRHLEHAPAPLRRSVLFELEGVFADDFARTQASRFRSSTDISVTNSLYHYYALLSGRAVQNETARARYIDTTTREGLDQLVGLGIRRDADFFCLNDGSFPEIEEAHRSSRVRNFLQHYFPEPAPWERVELRSPGDDRAEPIAV
ncbi:stealth conserved region 3 domain-containing protein [Nocardia sp. NPDC088792]|uniref:stealth conserved region 3 domain-containing protein n=1 Tax=Nocardia sp. NPDC088792 TaxID=3364332 RepID=UPI00382C3CD5